MAASQGDDCIVWIRLLAASALARSAVSSGHVIRDVRMSRDLTVVPSVDVLVHAIKFHLEQICTPRQHPPRSFYRPGAPPAAQPTASKH